MNPIKKALNYLFTGTGYSITIKKRDEVKLKKEKYYNPYVK